MNQSPKTQMDYRYLGNSGLRVSVIGYGCGDASDQELLTKLVKKAYDSGINFFDCAELYGKTIGAVETLLGGAFKALNLSRDDLVITTKIFWGGDVSQVNRRGLSRKHLIEGTKASLKRMQLDHVDVLFAHRYDPNTPMEEICRAFDWLVRKGYTHYWGTSEWSAQKIEEAFRVCEKLRLIKPIAEQPEYSLLVRERFEKEYAGLYESHRYGTTVWSPLAGGVLTGKYDKEIPQDSRATSALSFLIQKYIAPENIEHTRKQTAALAQIAKELNSTPARLALAWTIRNRDVSTAIMGARKVEQFDDNILAIEDVRKITPEIEERIEQIFKNRPETEMDHRLGKKIEPRRKIATA